MRRTPDYQFQILAEDRLNEEMVRVENDLAQYMRSGTFTAFDGTEMHYEFCLADQPKANVVIVHGLSEFTKKFYEFMYYLLNQGYNVFVYDQRCHGLSGRLTRDPQLLHVDRFADYVKDLEQFIDEIVTPTEALPIYLYAHSMGGAISAWYLAKHPDKVEKAVLAAPMFEPVVNSVPTPLARESVRLGRVVFGPKKRFFLSSDFNPDIQYKPTHGTSETRFYYNIQLRKNNTAYQSSPMSFGWVHGSLTICRTVLRNRLLKNVQTPILLISAENDTTVQNAPQRKFAAMCKTCEFVELKGETHALLASNNAGLSKIMNLVLDFYAR